MSENTQKSSKLTICLIVLGVVIVGYLGVYAWAVYLRSSKAEARQPKPMVNKMIGALKSFHKQVGRYPADFRELNTVIWHNQPSKYGESGREATAHHYFYYYEPVDHHTCLLWALPLASQGEASTQSSFFLVMTPEYIKNWRGPALDVEKAKVIKQRQEIVPTLEELEKAGLIEQKTITQY